MSKIVIANVSGDFENLETFRNHLVRGLLRDRIEFLIASGTLDESVSEELGACLRILREQDAAHAETSKRAFDAIFTVTGTTPVESEPPAAETEPEPEPHER